MNIVVIGTIYVDIKGHARTPFMPDGRNAGFVEYVHGGVGRNIAEDLAALGDSPVFVSLVEPGGTGDAIVSHLERVGVSTRFVDRVEHGSGTWLAIFDDRGDVFSSVSARADVSPLAGVIEAHHADIFPQADYVILEIDMDRETIQTVFDYARRYGKKVCCAVALMGDALDKTDFIREADLFICNQQEAGMLVGKNLADCEPAEILGEAKRYIAESNLKNLVVTMADKGAVFVDAYGNEGICPAVAATVVDTTGAGDSFCAGLCTALARGLTLEDACDVGAKVAASVIAHGRNTYAGPAFEELA